LALKRFFEVREVPAEITVREPAAAIAPAALDRAPGIAGRADG